MKRILVVAFTCAKYSTHSLICLKDITESLTAVLLQVAFIFLEFSISAPSVLFSPSNIQLDSAVDSSGAES